MADVVVPLRLHFNLSELRNVKKQLEDLAKIAPGTTAGQVAQRLSDVEGVRARGTAALQARAQSRGGKFGLDRVLASLNQDIDAFRTALQSEFVRQSVTETVANLRLQNQQTQALIAAEGSYINEVVRSETLARQLNASILQAKAANEEYITATVQAARAQATLNATIAQRKQGDSAFLAAAGAERRAEESLRQRERLAEFQLPDVAGEDVGARARRKGILDREEQALKDRARLTELGLADIAGTSQQEIGLRRGRIQAQERLNRIDEELISLGFSHIASQRTLTEQQKAGVLAARKEANQNLERIAAINETLGLDRRIVDSKQREAALSNRSLIAAQSDLDLAIQRRVAEQQLNRALFLRAREQARTGQIEQGSRFQRLQAGVANVGGRGGGFRLPTEFQTFGQFFTQRALSTVAFGVAGGGLFGLVRGIKEMITEAESLEFAFARVEAQFEAVFGDEAQRLLTGFKEDVLDIAQSTGTLADEIAQTGQRFLGVIGGLTPTEADVRATVEDLQAAFEFQLVTGVDTKKLQDEFIAIRAVFGITGREIGDLTVALQNLFGVNAEEILEAISGLGPIVSEIIGKGAEAAQEVGILVAATAQVTNKSAAELSERLGRVFARLPENVDEITQFFLRFPELESLVPNLAEVLGSGDLKELFLFLLENFDKLRKESRLPFAELLAGPREAQDFILVLQQGKDIVEAIRQGIGSEGALGDAVGNVENTLSVAAKRFERAFEELGIILFETGLSDALATLIDTGADVAKVLVVILDIMGDLNDVTDGLAGQILALATAFAVLGKAGKALGLAGILGGLGRGKVPFGFVGAGAAASAGRVGGGLGGAFTKGSLFAGGGAAAGGALGLGVIGLVAADRIRGAIDTESKKLREFETELETQLSKITIDEIEKLDPFKDFKPSLFERVTFTIFGGKSPGDIAEDARQRLVAPELIAQLQALDEEVVSELTERLDREVRRQEGGFRDRRFTSTEGLIKALQEDPESDFVQRRVEEVLEAAREDEGLAGILKAAQERSRLETSAAEGLINILGEDGEKVEAELRNFESAVADFKRGRISRAEFDAITQRILAFWNLAINFANFLGQDEVFQGFTTLIQDLARERNEAIRALNEQSLGFEAALLETQGRGVEAASLRVTGALDAATSGIEDLDIDQQQSIIQDYFAAQEALLKAMMDAATSQEEATRIGLEGLPTPDEVRQIAVALQLRTNQEFITRTNQFIAALNISATDLSRLVAERLVLYGETVGQALTAISLAQRAVLENAKRTLSGFLANIINRFGFFGGLASEAGQQIVARLVEINQILASLSDVDFGDVGIQAIDPRSTTIQQGRDAGGAASDVQSKADELRKAQQDLLLAQNALDPLTLARLQIRFAQEQISRAGDEIEKIRGQIALIEGQRAEQEALADIGQSRIELQQSLAAFAGDTVEVARQQVLAAEQALSDLQKLGAQEAEINRAKAAVLDARRSLADTQLQDQLSDIDFLLQMEEITTQQAIAMLEGILRFGVQTQDQADEIRLRIKQLNDSLSTSLQFNLPPELNLPTPFEGRRLDQLGGRTFNDNRTQTVTIQVSTDADPDEIAAAISDVLNSAPTVGSAGRLF